MKSVEALFRYGENVWPKTNFCIFALLHASNRTNRTDFLLVFWEMALKYNRSSRFVAILELNNKNNSIILNTMKFFAGTSFAMAMDGHLVGTLY